MTEFEEKLLAVLCRIEEKLSPVARPRTSKAAAVPVDEVITTLQPQIVEKFVTHPSTNGVWMRLVDIEKVLFPAQGIYARKDVNVVRTKNVAAVLRAMGVKTRRLHGFSQFWLQIRA